MFFDSKSSSQNVVTLECPKVEVSAPDFNGLLCVKKKKVGYCLLNPSSSFYARKEGWANVDTFQWPALLVETVAG